MKFKGTDSYISTEDLSMAVNAAIELEKPLLIKGEPGTGKTMLAEQVATCSANMVFPVPGSPLIKSGFSSSIAAFTAMLKSSVEI